MGTKPHQVTVTLLFTADGKIQDVEPHPPAEKIDLGKPGTPIPLKSFKHDPGRLHSFVYEWGSPGSITIETTAGPKRITWPQ